MASEALGLLPVGNAGAIAGDGLVCPVCHPFMAILASEGPSWPSSAIA